MWMAHVFGPIAGVDEHQAVIGLDQLRGAGNESQQSLAEAIEQGAADRAVSSATEIMDLHPRQTRRCSACS